MNIRFSCALPGRCSLLREPSSPLGSPADTLRRQHLEEVVVMATCTARAAAKMP